MIRRPPISTRTDTLCPYAPLFRSAPITVAAMFVLSAALERTGVIDTLGRLAAKAGGGRLLLSLVTMMSGATFLSAFINNTPVVVILTPVVISLARTLDMAPSKLLKIGRAHV